MLRDPLAFVWRYALGWHSVPYDVQPLALDARAYGQLVHEILKRAVDTLESSRHGYSRATAQEIEAALADAAASTGESWPLDRSVPPRMLWQHILDAATRLALKALTLDETLPDTRSWTELAFGRDDEEGGAPDNLPWPPNASVVIPGTNVRVRGTIDRLDINAVGSAVRVSDYKTGAVPRRADQTVLGGGAELQRVIYALAARQLIPDDPRVVARLVFLVDESPRIFRLQDVDLAIGEIAADVTAARAVLLRGIALPGPDAREQWNDFRLALPAAAGFFQVKQAAVSRAFGDFSRVWSRR
jgi:RecB family exonuclease